MTILMKHEYIKPKLGEGCVRCGHRENTDAHKIDETVPRAVQRSRRWLRENEKEKSDGR